MLVDDDEYENFREYHTHSSNNPQVTIQKHGHSISLNKAAYQALGSLSQVDLAYNAKKRSIRIGPVEEGFEGTRVCRQGDSERYFVAGRAFSSKFGIEMPDARKFNAEVKDGRLFIFLTAASVAAPGPYSHRKRSTPSTKTEQLSFSDASSEKPTQIKSKSEIEAELEQIMAQGVPVEDLEQILRRIQARKTR